MVCSRSGHSCKGAGMGPPLPAMSEPGVSRSRQPGTSRPQPSCGPPIAAPRTPPTGPATHVSAMLWKADGVLPETNQSSSAQRERSGPVPLERPLQEKGVMRSKLHALAKPPASVWPSLEEEIGEYRHYL